MTTFTIPELAPIIASAHGSEPNEVPKYERRLRHLVANGILAVASKDGEGPKARVNLDHESASLASLLIFFGDNLNFDLKLQKKVAEATKEYPARNASGIYSGNLLLNALVDIKQGKDWAMILNLRSDKTFRVHFLPFPQSRANQQTEELLAASGKELLGRIVIGITGLVSPILQHHRKAGS